MKKLAIFVPIYNEEKIIEKNIKKLLSAAKSQALDINLYAVDDSSTDSTPLLLKKLEKCIPNFKLLRYEGGPSRRENLARAMAKAKESYIMFTDFDLAADVNNLRKIYDCLEQGADVVTGSRYSSNSHVKRSLFRLVISRIYNLFMRIYFRSRIRDHQCGFKGFKRNAFLEINKIVGYDLKKQRGWFWDAEVLIVAQKKHLKVEEFGVEWNEGKQSSFNIKRELRMLPYVLLLPIKLSKIEKNKD